MSPKLLILSATILVIVGTNLFFVQPPKLSKRSSTVAITECRACHQAITDSFMRTAHYLDSRPADGRWIKGSFEEGKNIFQYNPFMQVVMVKDGERYLQSGQVNGMETTVASFDFVIGSGRNGQTFLTWSGNQLFQLPVSYYAPARQWCNSPGFPNYFYFGRIVPSNCLECHTTYTKVLSHESMEYEKSSIIYGISCQRCHPGAAEHAAFQTANPQEKQSKHVINPAHLEKQAKMDACALCHSGLRSPLQPPFSFEVGDTLDKYSIGSPVSHQADTLDVHGNQYGLLTASKCYIKSTKMDCSTCHNVHNNEFQNTKLFSSKCASCHSEVSHSSLKMNKNIISENCIDCHMPVLASKKIQVNVKSANQLLPDYLHTHYISIYKNATKDFIKRYK